MSLGTFESTFKNASFFVVVVFIAFWFQVLRDVLDIIKQQRYQLSTETLQSIPLRM